MTDHDELMSWWGVARDLAAKSHLDALQTRLDDHRRERERSSFTVVIAGEFKRGKSLVLNQLLARDVVPVGPVPLTQFFCAVRHGAAEGLVITWADGSLESRTLRTDSFADLVIQPARSRVRSQPVEIPSQEPTIAITIDNPWLERNELELVDTPGTNEGHLDRLTQVRRALVIADLVILAVSATSPLSMTERRLLIDEVIARHIPYIIVVVTMLDLLAREERQGAFDELAARIRRLVPGVAVVAGPGLDANPDAIGELRSLVEERAGRSGLSDARNRRLAMQIADVANDLVRLSSEARAQQSLAADERKSARRAAMSGISRDSTQWGQLRFDLEVRRVEIAKSMSGLISVHATDVGETLDHELSGADNPALWWRQELPYWLRRALRSVTAQIEQELTNEIGRDIAWLKGEVERRFGAQALATPSVEVPVDMQLPDVDVRDLGKSRRIIRMATPALGLLLGLLSSGAGATILSSAASMGGGILGEQRISRLTDAQRSEVRKLVARTVDDTFAGFAADVDIELGKIYAAVYRELRAHHDSWLATRRAVLEIDASKAGDEDWTVLEREAADLRDRMTAVLSGDNPIVGLSRQKETNND